MANIKWSNYKVVCTTIGNQIVIGKMDSEQPVPGLSLLADKSEDKTDECVKAVMQHMDSLVPEDSESINFQIEGFGTLTWTPIEKEEDVDGN